MWPVCTNRRPSGEFRVVVVTTRWSAPPRSPPDVHVPRRPTRHRAAERPTGIGPAAERPTRHREDNRRGWPDVTLAAMPTTDRVATPWRAARRIAAEAATALPAEDVPLEHAVGRVLAGAVRARTDLPGSDTAAMDGYAVAGVGPRFCDRERISAGDFALVRLQHEQLRPLPSRACRARRTRPKPSPTQPAVDVRRSSRGRRTPQPPAASAFRNPRTAHAENPAASANAIP